MPVAFTRCEKFAGGVPWESPDKARPLAGNSVEVFEQALQGGMWTARFGGVPGTHLTFSLHVSNVLASEKWLKVQQMHQERPVQCRINCKVG